MLINGRKVEAFSCYMKNIPMKVVEYQKKVFDSLGMELHQELSNLPFHDYWLDQKINSLDFDILIFFDIDCIPLKKGLYDYIVDQISDNNSIIGVEQVNQTRSPNFVYAAPACFGITKEVFEKMDKPSFRLKDEYDCGGEFSWVAPKYNVNVKLFEIKSSLNKKWKCLDKRYGNGTIYDDWLYHQFEIRFHDFKSHEQIYTYQFIKKCKEIILLNEKIPID
jgi:hypothetical protein